jgi:hypothetical protein
MALRIIDCQATPTSITVVFSDPVNNATFAVFDPAVSQTASTITSVTGIPGNVATLTLPSPIHVGDQILVSVTGITLPASSQEPPPGPLAIGAVVKSALTIVNCVATPNLVVVYFSQPLDAATKVGSGNDPNLTSNYTVRLDSGQIVQPTLANYDTTSGVNATFLQFAPNQFQPGQAATVTVQNVTFGGHPIGNSGSNTFSTRVHDDERHRGRRNGEVKEVTESVEDAVAYPLLTEQVSFPSSAGGGTATGVAAAAPAGQGLGQVAARAVTDVLGWKVNTSDPRGFIGALTQSFTLTEVEGHVDATWNPRTYAVQTDFGGQISGAQASLYTRAKDALDQSLPLLDGLYPLDPDADPEYVKALREMARSQMNEIVKELGAAGGPSVLRVNTYFGILLGTPQPISFQPGVTVPVFDPDKIQGTLGILRDTYGIYFQRNSRSNPFSNSIEDEQDITNFRVISDYMTSLLQSWISNGQFFTLGSSTQPAFFGTQLVLISRQFSVIAETVNEVRFALDSVFIGPSERQTLLLQFADPNLPAIFLEDLLREIESFNEEASRLLQDGGRISVTNNLLPVLRSFRDMVSQARRPTNLRDLPEGFRTVRVRRTLDDLHDQLKDVITLVEPVGQVVPQPVQPPAEGFAVLNVSPNIVSGTQTNLPVTITGTGFAPGATCSFKATQASAPAISVNATPIFLSQNLLVAKVSVTVGVTTGTVTFTYDVSVTNPDGTKSDPLPRGFTVTS